jgi:hypothetical protein
VLEKLSWPLEPFPTPAESLTDLTSFFPLPGEIRESVSPCS